MRISGLWLFILPYFVTAFQTVFDDQTPIADDQTPPDTQVIEPTFTFSRDWKVVGPFQIGTREATWGADPLEFFGGFHDLPYRSNATFRSSLAPNGTVSWSIHEAKLSYQDNRFAYADLGVYFQNIDWDWLKEIYGWAAFQWQGWARGEIYVKSSDAITLLLHAELVLEYWIDDVHYWGGDFYAYRKAPIPLHLRPGVHTIEVRLVRDIRSMGGIGEPSVDVGLELQRVASSLNSLNGFDKDILISDVAGGDWGALGSPYASIFLRNDGEEDIFIERIEGMPGICVFELIEKERIKISPGQTRSVGFEIGCVPSYNRRINVMFKYRIGNQPYIRSFFSSIWPRVLKTRDEPQKVTYRHPNGVVSYFILRPPSQDFDCGKDKNTTLPVLLSLHGAGLEADADIVKHALDDLADLCAWVIFPTGVTPWSGDDWHNWGLADVEAAIATLPTWIEEVEWQGAGVDINKWLISGHSNGGQGAWYFLTHRPDKAIAAVVGSAYSSVQTYVPYTFWHAMEPSKEAIIQSSLLTYRHELLLENAKDIPVLQQHGGMDDNVPVYNARLMSQRIFQAAADSEYEYWEIPGRGHYWNGVLATSPISHFFRKHLPGHGHTDSTLPSYLRDFTVVVADPGDMGPKNGVKVLSLSVQGKLGKVSMKYDPLSGTCLFYTVNILSFQLPRTFDECSCVLVDERRIRRDKHSPEGSTLHHSHEGWLVVDGNRGLYSFRRKERQQGALDAIFRTIGPFEIVRHSSGTIQVALQISRNFVQYFGGDSEITDDYQRALNKTGNVISIAVGGDLPPYRNPGLMFPIEVNKDGQDGIAIEYMENKHTYSTENYPSLVAVFLRPLPDERLELVVWAAKEESLPIAARLVPMLTGSGQPDFIIADRTMMWKGVEGVLALGFFDSFWAVTAQSHSTI